MYAVVCMRRCVCGGVYAVVCMRWCVCGGVYACVNNVITFQHFLKEIDSAS